jgi:hypothetical protein
VLDAHAEVRSNLMWNPYVEEKVREYQARELGHRLRQQAALQEVGPGPRRATAGMIGRALVRLGTRLQSWAEASAAEHRLAGAEE